MTSPNWLEIRFGLLRLAVRQQRLAKKEKARLLRRAFSGCKSLTMSYFHTGIRTIIGAEAFHCPVRDGKEWYHLAMVIRHNLSTFRRSLNIQFIEQDRKSTRLNSSHT